MSFAGEEKGYETVEEFTSIMMPPDVYDERIVIRVTYDENQLIRKQRLDGSEKRDLGLDAITTCCFMMLAIMVST